MNQQIYLFNLKDAIKSLKSFPKIFKLLWGVNKLYLILISICNIIKGVLPPISILTTQFLLNAVQTSIGEKFSYVVYVNLKVGHHFN